MTLAPPLPDPRPPAAPSVPPAKIHPPGLAAGSIVRRAIAARLAAATSTRLVLVRAPAGFGKTTAMQQTRERLAADGWATAWLTLDRADNDLPRCLACLAAALQPLGIDAGGTGRLDPVGLVDDWSRIDGPFAFFLDEFEHIGAPAVTGLVGELLERLPRGGRLVVGSRSLPGLPLGRLRARGQLVEIDAAQLRFSPAEADAFFAARGVGLPRTALDRLQQRTEGWITALSLVAMALERHPVPGDVVAGLADALDGPRVAAPNRPPGRTDAAATAGGVPGFPDRAIADYLAEDVLAHQPADVRDFLLRTGILRTLDAPVCAALVPRVDAARMLQRLEAANLFIAPVGGPDGGWRYHALFARFLRAQLAAERPDEVARLHLAASGWYEAAGRIVPAIDHALDGGDPPHALHLLAAHAEAFLEQGRMRLLDRWFAALPADALAGAPRLQVIGLWATCFTRGAAQAMADLDRTGCAASDDPVVRAHVAALRPMLLAMLDRLDEACDAGRTVLDGPPSGLAFADSVLANAMAHVVSVLGARHEAHRLLDAARASERGSAFNRMYAESIEGLLDLAEGRLREATARFRMAVGASWRGAAWSPGGGNAWAGVLYVATVYEAGDLRAADRLLNVYLPLARDVGLPDHMIAGHRMRARIAFADGDVDAAFKTLAELEYLGHDRRLPRVGACARLERARLRLLQGHAAAARDELGRADDPALWRQVGRWRTFACELDDLAIGRLRWDVHAGDAARAADDLRAAAAVAERAGRRLRLLKLRTLCALAEARAGQLGAALDTLAGVLRATAPEGYCRLLVDEGPALVPLLRRLSVVDADGPIVADHVQHLLRALGADPEGAADVAVDAPPSPGAAESLTRAELRVLQLLAEGYSNSAMAEKLFVSDSTVRTHLRNINQKLGARSRTQALALARKQALLR